MREDWFILRPCKYFANILFVIITFLSLQKCFYFLMMVKFLHTSGPVRYRNGVINLFILC